MSLCHDSSVFGHVSFRACMRPCVHISIRTHAQVSVVWCLVVGLSRLFGFACCPCPCVYGVALTENTFSFKVLVSKDQRVAVSDSVAIAAIFVPLPQISIAISVPTQGSSFVVINANDKVQLTAVVTSSSAQPVSYSLEWVCVTANVNISRGSPALASSPTSPSLVINPGYLGSGNDLSYTFALILTSRTDSSKSTQARVNVNINGAPQGGKCSVAPSTGTALSTLFVFECINWDGDPTDNPIAYAFQLYDPIRSRVVSILRSAQPTGVLSCFLPAGTLTVMVEISDRYGATSVSFLSLSVALPDVSTPASVKAAADSALSTLALAQQGTRFEFGSHMCSCSMCLPAASISCACTDLNCALLITGPARVGRSRSR